ncbi:MAG: type II secretion system minor pseudopilin GspH [Gammaproteobacteria bacterium]|nr:type II secretion system minor pseudopilin GspH [Gammaproteobacteria bacterium]
MSMQRNTRGFTLIEILVVVIIIATISSLALLSLGLVGDDRDLGQERRRLASLMEVAQDEATMQGREFGLEFFRTGYRFVEFDPYTTRWSEIQYDDLLRLRELPEGMEFELYVEDKRVILATDPTLFEEPDDDEMPMAVDEYLPHLYLSASGDSTAFELRLNRTANNQELLMRGDILGNIEFGEDEN